LDGEVLELQKLKNALQDEMHKIQELDQEYVQLNSKVKNPAWAGKKAELQEKIDHPDKPVTTLEAAQRAKKDAAEAPGQLAEMEAIEKRVVELEGFLISKRDKFRQNEISCLQLAIQIGQKQQTAQRVRFVAEEQARLSQLKVAEDQASQIATQRKEREQMLGSLHQRIETGSKEIKQLRSEHERMIGALGEKKFRRGTAKRAYQADEALKSSAAFLCDITAKHVAEQTVNIRQASSEDVQILNLEKAEKLAKQASTHAQLLQLIINVFKQEF
jgi:hypothetical protein